MFFFGVNETRVLSFSFPSFLCFSWVQQYGAINKTQQARASDSAVLCICQLGEGF
jgi:hypothetical protein